ncbi:MAG TPA: murein biosynthesis integral membrane protein MurJ [Vicinamibacterales bacterium]|nr:murein biosynthesis integral membrane protein MurJ [Vicinamibacterales bacterium]
MGLARSAGIISVATMASRLLGLVRNWAVALFFGAGDAVDAFNVAARLPVLLRELFAEGAMSSAFVPTFTRTLKDQGPDAAWRLGSQVVNALLVVTGAIVVAGIAFADPLTHLYASRYADTPGKIELTVQLTRITMPFLTLIALAAVFMGMLNAMRQFFVPAISPAMFNVGMILGAVSSSAVGTLLGVHPIVGLALGFVLGGFGQMALQYPSLRRAGFRHRWILDVRDPGLRSILLLMGPGTIGQAAGQINLLVSTVLATGLGTSALSWLIYAFTFMYLPIGIFGVSVSTASVPDLAIHASGQAWAEMRRVLSAALRLMLTLTVPSAVGLMVLGAPIVELAHEWGAFTATDTQAVALALLAYAPGLVAYNIVKISTPAFYAMQDARTPVMSSAIAIGTNIVLSLVLVRYLGYVGLAAATTLASWVNASLLLVLLSRRVGGLDFARVGVTAAKVSVAAAVMGAVAWWVEAALHARLPDPTLLDRLVRVGGAITTAVAAYGAVAALLRIEEFTVAVERVVARLRR